ncbi:MAG: 50S ribosomal protein L2 [Candidatus Micrarchaeota archaeon]|nr:50S ribosomal protein L2 [Candidatus Micrarchaeota archaeon]
MGKRIIPQRRGKGSLTYKVPSKPSNVKVEYRESSGVVADIVSDPLKTSPVAKVSYDDNSTGFIIAPQGIKVGESVNKYVMPLSKVSEGSSVFAIETYPRSGPKICRAAGSFALVISKSGDDVIIQLPSRKKKRLKGTCMATLGVPAGEGRSSKPWLKAGKRWIVQHKKGKLYPRTSGVAMNAVDHPFGCGYSGLGKHKTISRHAPPGRKIGSIAAKRTGRTKK